MNIKKISHQILKSLSLIFLNELENEKLKSITITEVVATKDLDIARIYFNAINSQIETKELLKELESVSGILRKKISQKLNLRKTPKLKFYYDDTQERVDRIEQIINKL